jgi:IPT/TIG domain-containing protein
MKYIVIVLLCCTSLLGQTTQPKAKAKDHALTLKKVNPSTTTSLPSVSLSATAATTGQPATGFNFYRFTLTSGSCPSSGFTVLGASPMTTTPNYTDTTVSPGVTYCYAVTGVNSGGESGFSNIVQAVVPALVTIASMTPNSGAAGGGTAVTVTGSNFVSGASVMFGSAAATSVVVVNSTTLTAVAPAGSGVVTVTVTNGGSGGSASLLNGFTYVGAPNAPTGLAVTGIVADNVTLHWNLAAAQSGFTPQNQLLYDCSVSTCPGPPLVAKLSATATSYTTQCTHTNKTCYFVLKATALYNKKLVTSVKSNIVTAKVTVSNPKAKIVNN